MASLEIIILLGIFGHACLAQFGGGTITQEQMACLRKALRLNPSQDAAMCTCLNVCKSTQPTGLNDVNETPPGLISEYSTEKYVGTGLECLRHHITLGYTMDEAMCQCSGESCPESPVSGKPHTTTEMWFGKGEECLIRVHMVYKLNLTEAEISCLCMDACTDEEIRDLKSLHIQKAVKEKLNEDKVTIGIQTTILCLIFITGIFGNLLVIITVAAFMGKTTVTNMYICSLAAADLLVILACVPFKIVETTQAQWEGGDIACRVVAWLYFASFMCSVFTLATMSMERFLVICYPVFSHVISSTRRTAVIIAVIWILAAVLSCPSFYVIKTNAIFPNTTVYTCEADTSDGSYGKRIAFYIYIFLLIFLVPSILMCFAYIKTSIALWESIKKQRELKSPTKGNKGQPKVTSYGRVQVIRVLIIVLVVFIVCWFPYLTVQLIDYGSNKEAIDFLQNKHIRKTAEWFTLLSLANSCFNPVLYGFLSRRFREGFLRCLKCDRQSVNKKRSSVITATSSMGGSIHKQSSYKKNSVKMAANTNTATLDTVHEDTATANGVVKSSSQTTLDTVPEDSSTPDGIYQEIGTNDVVIYTKLKENHVNNGFIPDKESSSAD